MIDIVVEIKRVKMLNAVKYIAVSVAMGFAISGSIIAGPNEALGVYEKAFALEPDIGNGEEVYMICSSCHLQEGWGLKDGTYPQIAGQYREVLIQQLSDIHAQNRDNPTMYPFALPEAIGDEQAIADVAAYIEQMKMTQNNGKGNWAEGTSEFAAGEKLYAEYCAECHGVSGEGDPNQLYPKIHGQHYNYLLRQLEWMRAGKRRGVRHNMLKNVNKFSVNEIAYVANFVSWLSVPKKDLAK